MIDENSLAIGKWGYILFGTCVIQKKKVSFCITSTRNPRSFKCKGMGKSDNLLTSETIPPPERFADREQADPPRNEVPQPDPANFKVRKLFLSLRPSCLDSY